MPFSEMLYAVGWDAASCPSTVPRPAWVTQDLRFHAIFTGSQWVPLTDTLYALWHTSRYQPVTPNALRESAQSDHLSEAEAREVVAQQRLAEAFISWPPILGHDPGPDDYRLSVVTSDSIVPWHTLTSIIQQQNNSPPPSGGRQSGDKMSDAVIWDRLVHHVIPQQLAAHALHLAVIRWSDYWAALTVSLTP